MHMLSRDNISFDDFLGYLGYPPYTYSELNIYKECFETDLWLLIFIKCEIKERDSTRITHILEKKWSNPD